MIKITRDFSHDKLEKIGSIELDMPDGDWILNGKVLPASSRNYLAHYAFRALQDAYAGAKTASEIQGAYDKRLDRIMAGTIGVREGGVGLSAFEAEVRRIAYEAYVDQIGGGKTAAAKAFAEASTAEQDAILDPIIARNSEALEKAATSAIAAKEALREARKAGKAGIKITL